MKYNFETFQDRRNTGSAKYAKMLMDNPNVSEGIVPMSTADMEFNVAPEIIEGLQDYLEDSILGYQIVTDEYKDIVVDWYARRYDTRIEPEWISTAAGVVDAFYGAVLAFTEENDGVIVMLPVYGPFFGAIEDNNRRVVSCDLIDDNSYYKIDFEKFEELAKDENNTALLFCNPSNPGGRAWTREELERLGNICLENGLTIISDEIHGDFIRPGYEFTSFLNISDEITDITVVCHAPNKTFNIAGLMSGNTIVPNPQMKEKYDEVCAKTKLSGTNSLALKATELAYTEGDDWLDELLIVLDDNIKYFTGRMEEEMPEVRCFDPEATYLVWMDMSGLGMNKEELDDFLINDAELFLNPGEFFRAKEDCYKRINLACPKYVIVDAVDRLVGAYKKR